MPVGLGTFEFFEGGTGIDPAGDTIQAESETDAFEAAGSATADATSLWAGVDPRTPGEDIRRSIEGFASLFGGSSQNRRRQVRRRQRQQRSRPRQGLSYWIAAVGLLLGFVSIVRRAR